MANANLPLMEQEHEIDHTKLGSWWSEWSGSRQQVAALSPEEVALDSIIAQYERAVHYRRTIEYVLRPHRVTFAMWRVLYALHQLVREADDGVNQEKICARTSIRKSSMPPLVSALLRREFINIVQEPPTKGYLLWARDPGMDFLNTVAPALVRALGIVAPISSSNDRPNSEKPAAPRDGT